ncbi:LysR family transcriptional regulator [Pararhizobium sp.]|uniref:LysR family transcriptional regulator n=1 Tax=Pararhizobium sp. TaxID=1977563 RepID=UPI003BAA29F7
MKQIHLPGIDLNLLVIFDALFTEGHVTRAAKRLGLTQPAVSHALGRLRHLFDDPLFIRSPKGMIPTAAATDMAAAIRTVLDQVEVVLGTERSFDPSVSTRRFAIGLSDYSAFVLLPQLSVRITSEAPGVSLLVRHTNVTIGHSMLAAGDVELIAGVFPPPPSYLREEMLYEDDFVCAGRLENPGLADTLDLDRYLSLRHLQVSMRGEPHGLVDQVLEKIGKQRSIALTAGHFLMAPLLVQDTDLIATEPRRLFERWQDKISLRLLRPPLDIPSFRVVQAWHARHDADEGHAWLRRMIGSISETV